MANNPASYPESLEFERRLGDGRFHDFMQLFQESTESDTA
jgi:hypothetical protein